MQADFHNIIIQHQRWQLLSHFLTHSLTTEAAKEFPFNIQLQLNAHHIKKVSKNIQIYVRGTCRMTHGDNKQK